MPTVIFDFDGTICYAPSSVHWTRDISLIKRLYFPFAYLFEKLTKKPAYQRKAFEWLVGHNVKKTRQSMKKIPGVPKTMKLLSELKSKKYRIIVMSFSPAYFVNAWLSQKGFDFEVICPDIVVNKKGEVEKVSDDWITKEFLDDPIHAKKKVLKKYHIKPNLSVGDNTKRDKLSDVYIDIKKYQENYKSKIRQVFEMMFK